MIIQSGIILFDKIYYLLPYIMKFIILLLFFSVHKGSKVLMTASIKVTVLLRVASFFLLLSRQYIYDL